jgi:hypothetical protein
MAERSCRVTVVGTAKRVDVAVPAGAPIGLYSASLAQLCGEPDSDIMPAAWSLATVERGALSPDVSLAACGIVDGQVLYLRDRAVGEYDEAGVFEVAEVVAAVAEQAGGPPWSARARAAAVLVAGAAWLATVAAGALGAATLGTGARVSAAPLAAGTGLMLAATAWVARSPRLGIGTALRVTLALGALPGLAVAGCLVGLSRSGGHAGAGMAGLAGAGLAGALIALLAVPSVATLAAAAVTAAAAVVTVALVLLHAGLAGSAAVVALVSYLMVLLAPRAAGRLAATWALLTGRDGPEVTVVQARLLLAAGNILACTALAVTVVILGASPNPFAIVLAVTLSLAVLLHTPSCSFVAEAGPAVVAGLAGLLSVLLFAAGHLDLPAWVSPVTGVLLGMAALAAGLALSLGTAERAAGDRAWSRLTASACFLAAVPLAIGVFGVFGTLMHMGQHV